MRIITNYMGKQRNETKAHTEYTAVVKFIVTDIEREDGIEWEQWILDNLPYIPIEVELDNLGIILPDCNCEECKNV